MRALGTTLLFLLSSSTLFACQKAESTDPDDSLGGAGPIDREPSEELPEIGEATSVTCETNRDCDDGAFCNGVEHCVEGYCHLGIPPSCDDGIDCTIDSCSHVSNACLFRAPDQDGDGHADAGCTGPLGEALGDDCDDDDPNRYPGNVEVCSTEDSSHDEDCNPSTIGHLDEDEDGYVSAACCNESDSGDICGEDCDDTDFSRFPAHPEICDGIDNDCDGEVDVNTKEVLWFPDEDGDHYGEVDAEGVLDCSPVEGHALRATDCDDKTAAVHAAAREVCDGADNDCDGEVDEERVCACAPEGNAQACACRGGGTGVQTCDGGLWGSCDCTECETGVSDCLGDLLPRTCEDGQWVVHSACKGLHPLCLDGACVCADGTSDCQLIEDRIQPQLVGTFPRADTTGHSLSLTLSATFSEDLLPSSATINALSLRDILGNEVPGSVVVSGPTLAFTPLEPLLPGMDYTWELSELITDVAGNSLARASAVKFGTELAVVSQPLEDPPRLAYNDPTLAVSPGGVAKIIAQRVDETEPGMFTVLGVSELEWSSDSWVDSGIVFEEQGDLRTLTVDDQGRAIATRTLDGIVYRYDKGTQGWNAVLAPLSSDDTYGLRPAFAANGRGDALLSVRSEGLETGYVRDAAGTWSTFTSSTQLIEGFRMADVSESGHGIVAFEQDSALKVLRSTTSMTQWTLATTIGSLAEPIEAAAVTMLESGQATVARIQRLDEGGPAYSQVQVQDLNASGLWVDSPTFAGGSFKEVHESYPFLGSDGANNTHLIYTRGGTDLMWMYRPAGEVFQEPVQLLPGVNGLNFRFAVAENGVAVALWLARPNSAFDLFMARYIPGLGWETQQHLELDNQSVHSDFHLGVDKVGNAHILFKTDSWRTIYVPAPAL